jgi:phage-related protein
MILEMAIARFLDNKVKKSQKTPKKEIDLAVKRKKEHAQYDP